MLQQEHSRWNAWQDTMGFVPVEDVRLKDNEIAKTHPGLKPYGLLTDEQKLSVINDPEVVFAEVKLQVDLINDWIRVHHFRSRAEKQVAMRFVTELYINLAASNIAKTKLFSVSRRPRLYEPPR